MSAEEIAGTGFAQISSIPVPRSPPADTDGRTNEEIGVTLGISKKTAQHHVAHGYRKLGVTGRVGATVWLAQRGFVGNRH